MNVSTITLDPEQAQAKLEAYRADRHVDADAMYRECERVYEQLAQGTPAIDIRQVFEECPLDEQGRPRMAIARADRKQVRFSANRYSEFCVFDVRRRSAQ